MQQIQKTLAEEIESFLTPVLSFMETGNYQLSAEAKPAPEPVPAAPASPTASAASQTPPVQGA